MKTILITGRMGVGKSLLLSFFKKRGYPVFSADDTAKKLLHPESPCYNQIKKLFPEAELYHKDGFFHKKKLARFLFKSPERKKSLERIIHPRTRDLFKEFVREESKKQSPFLFYEAPLISKEILKSCDFSVLLISSYEKQEERLLRLGWTKQEIKERLRAQISEAEAIETADFIIENRTDRASLEERLDLFLEKLKKYKQT